VESGLWTIGSPRSSPLVGVSAEPYSTGQDLVKVGAGRLISSSTSGGPLIDIIVAPRMDDRD